MAFKLTATSAPDESARQGSFDLAPAPFDDPDRDALRKLADHYAASAPEPEQRERWNAAASLLSDPNPNFEADAKRAAASRVRAATAQREMRE